MGNTRHGRETLLLRALAGGESERTHRAPVESTEKSDKARASANIPRQFQCAFHRFGAGLAEETEHRLPIGESALIFSPSAICFSCEKSGEMCRNSSAASLI